MSKGFKLALGCLGTFVLVSALTTAFCAYLVNRTPTATKEAAAPAAPRAARPTPVPPLPKGTPLPSGKWQVSSDTSKIDDSKTVVLSLPSESAVSGWPATTHRPTLILRCQEKRTQAYITTGMAPNVEYGHSDEGRVTLRFDKEPAINVWAGKSTDGEALFLPSTIDRIRKMSKSESMLFRFTPYHSSPQETEFDLRGLSFVLPYLQEACGWK
jgi:type VI secretion system protein VasI